MILVDYRQIILANLFQMTSGNCHRGPSVVLDKQAFFDRCKASIGKIRTIGHPETSLLFHNSRVNPMILCLDSSNTWRKALYPAYKLNRTEHKLKTTNIDWAYVDELYNETIGMMEATQTDIRFIKVDGTEADDIIAVLTRHLPAMDTLIVSSDKDFMQLQSILGVHQWSPLLKKFLVTSNASMHLKEHIIRGDDSDNIPNILSPLPTVPTVIDAAFEASLIPYPGKKTRQKTITKKMIEKWMPLKPEEFCITQEMMERYQMNRSLIAFEYIPLDVEDRILKAFAS